MLIAILLLSAIGLSAQSNIKTYNYKKGQVLDIIFLNTKPDAKEELDLYFKTAFPVATNYGYTGQGGLALPQSPIQGNYHPESMIFGYWKDLNSREEFLAKIEETMPHFHQSRRNIWSSFNMTFWEMKEDFSFEVNSDKFNIVTAYWQKDASSFKRFKADWIKKSKAAGGREVLNLTNGDSPFGYYYNPDFFVITEWDNKADFDKFYQENLKMNHEGVKHVNQLIIQ